jgi:hypothetical protein
VVSDAPGPGDREDPARGTLTAVVTGPLDRQIRNHADHFASSMPDLIGVSHDVSEAARDLANEAGRATYRATCVKLAGCAGVPDVVPDINAHILANNAPIMAAGAYLAGVVRRDIAAAVRAERVRCRMAVARAQFDGAWTCTDDALSAIDAG